MARTLEVAIASVLMASCRRTALLLLQAESGKLRLDGVVGPMQRGRDAVRCDERQILRRSDGYTGKAATITDYSDRTIREKKMALPAQLQGIGRERFHQCISRCRKLSCRRYA